MSPKAQTIDSWLKTHAAHQPDKVALRFKGSAWTYAALLAWVDRLASGLHHGAGLRRGDRIGFLGQNSATEIALLFAAAKLGLIFVPLNWRLAVEELRYSVEAAGLSLLVHGADFAQTAREVATQTCLEDVLPLADEACPKAALQDPFLLVFTSGTTGRPKGAVLTQEAVLWNALASLHAHDLTAEDHALNVLPLFHVGGINIQVMPTFFIGGTVTLAPGFDPAETLRAFEEDGITTSVCVPTMMRALMALPGWQDATFPTMRVLNTGSTDVPVDILEAMNGRGVPMVQVYGATETGPIATYQRAAEAAETIGSIGRVAAHSQARVMRPDGTECDVDEPGEMWIKGPNTFAEYWRDPEATKAAMADGWFRTGDIVRRDAGGLYWFVGRLKYVIISGGENIYPAEIERILDTLPGLKEVAVVGRPDPRWGEVPVVVAVRESDGPGAEEILAACDGKIARYKRPKDVVIVPALPRNALGKVVIDEVRAMSIR